MGDALILQGRALLQTLGRRETTEEAATMGRDPIKDEGGASALLRAT